MAIKNLGDGVVTKLAADANPTATSYPAGTVLRNSDDFKRWINSGTEWIPQEHQATTTLKVFKSGTTYYVINQHGKAEGSGSVFHTVINTVLSAMPVNSTYIFNFDAGTYTQDDPILIPSSVGQSTNVKRVIFNGEWVWARTGPNLNTVFRPSTSFTTNRYSIEANNAPGSGTTAVLGINGLCFTGNDVFTTKNVGFIKYQTDINADRTIEVNNIWAQYCWRPLHLLGGVWWGRFVNINTTDSSAAFYGNSDLILEGGGALGSGNPSPKYCYFENIYFNHAAGQMDYFIQIKNGSYNFFNFPTMDGHAITTAAIALDNNTDSLLVAANNVFVNPNVLDVGAVPSPDNRQAGIWLNGQYVYNNWFYAVMVNKIINHVKFSNGTMRNYVQTTGHWGTALTTSSTGAGVSNILEIVAGSTVAATDTALADTGGLLRVIDKRRGAENSGFTSVADGGTITHGLMTTPLWVIAVASVAGEMASVTAKSTTTFTVALKKHDNSAGTTQSVYWRAGVYA